MKEAGGTTHAMARASVGGGAGPSDPRRRRRNARGQRRGVSDSAAPAPGRPAQPCPRGRPAAEVSRRSCSSAQGASTTTNTAGPSLRRTRPGARVPTRQHPGRCVGPHSASSHRPTCAASKSLRAWRRVSFTARLPSCRRGRKAASPPSSPTISHMARDGVVGDLRRGRLRARPATTTGSDPAGLFRDVQTEYARDRGRSETSRADRPAGHGRGTDGRPAAAMPGAHVGRPASDWTSGSSSPERAAAP